MTQAEIVRARAAPVRAVLVLAAIATFALATSSLGCTKNQLLDIAMSGTTRPIVSHDQHVGDRLILAGDMHCHVLPPDSAHHVSRELPETLALAKSEGLDFVVLTPHVPARFYMDDEMRGWVLETQAELRARLARLKPELLVIPGFEYTDFRNGHLGMAFAEPSEVLEGLTSEEARSSPERFFEMWVARGGILTINHPMNRPLPKAPFHELGADMSWRAFRGERSATEAPEIAWITTHATTIETFNSMVSGLRDQLVIGDEERSLREASHVADEVVRTQHRRIASVGGSDSHGSWLRATTFVLAKDRSIDSLRKGIAGARTCVRGPQACTLELRNDGGAWLGVGDAITTTSSSFEARASGDDATFIVNGAHVATGSDGEIVKLTVPTDRCSIVRAIVGRSWSSGIYVNCF
jgi:hypothetical protein